MRLLELNSESLNLLLHCANQTEVNSSRYYPLNCVKVQNSPILMQYIKLLKAPNSNPGVLVIVQVLNIA